MLFSRNLMRAMCQGGLCARDSHFIFGVQRLVEALCADDTGFCCKSAMLASEVTC